MGCDCFLVDDFSYSDFFFSQREVQGCQEQGAYRTAGGSLERCRIYEGKVDIFVFPGRAVCPQYSFLVLDATQGFTVIFELSFSWPIIQDELR